MVPPDVNSNNIINLWTNGSAKEFTPGITLVGSGNLSINCSPDIQILYVVDSNGIHLFACAHVEINPKDLYIYDEDQNVGLYATQYTISISVLGADPGHLVRTTPENQVDSTEITVGDSVDFGIDAGFAGPKPEVKGSIGYSADNEHTYSLPDVIITNNSKDLTASWSFDIPQVNITSGVFDRPKNIQKSNFAADVDAYWRYDQLHDNMAMFQIRITATMNRTYIDHGIWASLENDTNIFSGSADINIKIPPRGTE
ncbi:hypothetical protein [Azospirillum sp. B4]|uniref:hypothetical protein n=1 Tax=Azospirillum sp. B4 TaxID=95605 RepID=UPI0011DCEC5C|nr:hypothetical protein [Azospirillum sp. B4]